ncbi:glycosyl hydrolase [Paenibacillus bouchesdurhonensis]|uniref:glycosyl hydrolase n=1 Tax=Paenibacillus bouchesdurhonensis TaxID=1870990 RepID=UPI000DA601AE|nr:glycosyl hydrolase [Paenibacillus bouchesdurhonensis]
MKAMSISMARAAQAKRKFSVFVLCIVILMGMLGSTASMAEASSAVLDAGMHIGDGPFVDPTNNITVTYTDAMLEGYGVEKRGSVNEDDDTLYDGEGYISYFFDEVANATEPIGSATFTVDVAEAGLFKLSLGYYIPEGYGDKVTSIEINGAGTGELALDAPATGTVRAEKMVSKVLLNAGSNTIKIVRGWGYYGIEHIKLEPANAAASGNKREAEDGIMSGDVSIGNSGREYPVEGHKAGTLNNPEATPEARALMSYLLSQYGQKIISGQQTLEDVEWIKQQTGKYPAIFSTDLMDYSPSRVDHGASSTEIEKMIEWYKRGGIVSLCWHWNAPKGIGGNEPGNEWWRGFYTEFTTFDVEYALNHPDSEDYQLLLRDIDAIAVQLKRLQDANVPVLWRPLHEAEGTWFWWGAKGAEPTKQLYRLLYDRLTHYHKLNNLIWVWNSEKKDWYPGDDIVDIVSVDIYNPEGDYNPSIAKYETLVSLVNDKKMAALAENGPIPDPDILQAYGADWSFFSTWTGHYIRDGKTNTMEHLNKVYHHEYVITLDELPADLYSNLKFVAENGESTGMAEADEQKSHLENDDVTGMEPKNSFTDIESHWAKNDIELMLNQKVVFGIGYGQFAPNRPITRAEISVLIARAIGLDLQPATGKFSDVERTSWYAGAIEAISEAKIMVGFADGTFQPNAQVTREQMAVLIARTMAFTGQNPALTGNSLAGFTDLSSVSAWAAASVNEVLALGLIQGVSTELFAPEENVDRAQAVVMIKRLLVYLNLANF